MSNKPEIKKRCIYYDKGLCHNAILGKYCFENDGLWCDYCVVPKVTEEKIKTILTEHLHILDGKYESQKICGISEATKEIYDLIKGGG